MGARTYAHHKPTINSGEQRAPQLGFRRLAFSSGHDLRLLEKRRINLDA